MSESSRAHEQGEGQRDKQVPAEQGARGRAGPWAPGWDQPAPHGQGSPLPLPHAALQAVLGSVSSCSFLRGPSAPGPCTACRRRWSFLPGLWSRSISDPGLRRCTCLSSWPAARPRLTSSEPGEARRRAPRSAISRLSQDTQVGSVGRALSASAVPDGADVGKPLAWGWRPGTPPRDQRVGTFGPTP